MRPDDSSTGSPPSRPTTQLQSVADIMALARRPKTITEPIGNAPIPADHTALYRPSRRPPVPILRILDDGQRSAESIRIRKSPFLIGRMEGDLTFPLDSGISGRHAELCLGQKHGQPCWQLRDLDSTNGTFVRAARAILAHNQILLLGSRCYVFDMGTPTPASPAFPPGHVQATSQWQAVSSQPSATTPALVERTGSSPGTRHPLSPAGSTLGRNAGECNVCLDDPLVDPCHANLFRDGKGRWCIEDAKSLNGVWVQVDEIYFLKNGYFQCGEQRFLLELP